MNIKYERATLEDIDLLTKTRIRVLKAANQLSDDVNMNEYNGSVVKTKIYDFYNELI